MAVYRKRIRKKDYDMLISSIGDMDYTINWYPERHEIEIISKLEIRKDILDYLESCRVYKDE